MRTLSLTQVITLTRLLQQVLELLPVRLQFVEGAPLHDSPVLDEQHVVHVSQKVQLVGDHHPGPAVERAANALVKHLGKRSSQVGLMLWKENISRCESLHFEPGFAQRCIQRVAC